MGLRCGVAIGLNLRLVLAGERPPVWACVGDGSGSSLARVGVLDMVCSRGALLGIVLGRLCRAHVHTQGAALERRKSDASIHNYGS